MKPRLLNSARISFPLASAIATLFAAQSAQAVSHFWDNNSTTTGFGTAGGTWGTSALWTLTSGGGAPHSGVTLITTSDAANFGTDSAGGGLGGGTISVSGTVNAASIKFGNQTTSAVTLSGGIINLAAITSINVGAGSTNHTISSQITGAATSLTKLGPGGLVLSGNSSYIGQTIISGGTLFLNNSTVLGGNNPGVNGTSSISMAANTTLQSNYAPADLGISDSYIYAPITLSAAGTNNFFIGAGSSTSPAESVRFNLNGAIGGTAGANVVFGNTTAARNNADSIIVLGAASTYNGNTTIQAGNNQNRINVISGAVNALPATTVLGFDAVAGTGSGRTSQFDLNGNNQTLAGLTSPTAVADRSHRVTSATAATLTINNTADYTFAATSIGGADPGNAQITGAISLTKNGTGTFTLGAGNGHAFTGDTKILGGILVLGHSNSIQSSAFDTGGSIVGNTTNGLRSGVTTLTLGGLKGGNDFSTRFTTTTGGYTGLTALTLNPGTGVTNSYSGDIGDGATGMNLTKTGAGTQTLTGTITHTGSTSVTVGVLAVNGTLANTSATTVSGTGILKGSGTVNSSVTINSGGTLASGNSIESLAVGGDLSFTTGSNFQYELDADPAEQGDLTALTGSLSLTGTVNLSFIETGSGSWELGNPLGDHFGSPAADKLTLISYNGTWNGGLFTWLGNLVQDNSGITINGQQWWFNYNDTDAGTNFTGDLGAATTFVTITVPEPNAAALLGGLGFLALLRRRRIA